MYKWLKTSFASSQHFTPDEKQCKITKKKYTINLLTADFFLNHEKEKKMVIINEQKFI